MNSLAKITERAQRDANRTGRTMLVINLNQYSPLYVIRESNDNTAMTKGVVVIVPPQARCGQCGMIVGSKQACCPPWVYDKDQDRCINR